MDVNGDRRRYTWTRHKDEQLRIPVLGLDRKGSFVQNVTLLGSRAKLSWKQDEATLTVALSPEKPCEHA